MLKKYSSKAYMLITVHMIDNCIDNVSMPIEAQTFRRKALVSMGF